MDGASLFTALAVPFLFLPGMVEKRGNTVYDGRKDASKPLAALADYR